jgi:hypothetical protein
VYRRYAYDFRGYARASLRRRLWRRAQQEGVRTLSGLQERVLHDPMVMDRLLRDLSINVTEMFRDPGSSGAAREGRPDPADLSVRAHLERRLLDRRGDVLAGDRARGGGACSTARASTRPT